MATVRQHIFAGVSITNLRRNSSRPRRSHSASASLTVNGTSVVRQFRNASHKVYRHGLGVGRLKLSAVITDPLDWPAWIASLICGASPLSSAVGVSFPWR
jgi:hypothetical protein